MSLICPTVTSEDTNEFNNQLKLVTSFANRVHLDFMDGVFAPSKSPELQDIQLPKPALYDMHIMYKEPQQHLDTLIKLQPNLVIIHAESDADIPKVASILQENNIKTGLAILPSTNINKIGPLLLYMQHVLIFGGHLGYHGGQADLTLLKRLNQIKHINSNLEVSWDGGANLNNVTQIMQAGADIINVGGAIHRSANPKEVFYQLQTLVS